MSLISRVLRLFVCLLPLALVIGAGAQVSRGTISGRVADSTGAVVPNAPVIATDQATGANYKGVSDSAGQYTIPFLAPSKYRVTVGVGGFKTFVRENVVVDANERGFGYSA